LAGWEKDDKCWGKDSRLATKRLRAPAVLASDSLKGAQRVFLLA